MPASGLILVWLDWLPHRETRGHAIRPESMRRDSTLGRNTQPARSA